jgi:sarcosine oxidase
MARYDAAVIGLGATGSAALHQLTRRGLRVVGVERFAPGHDRGSSHGETRIIRLGYFEHPSYVPLLRQTYALWRELEAAAGQKLLHITGIVEIGPPEGELVTGTLAASRMHGLPHEVLDAFATMRRFPAFQRLPSRYVGVVQPDGGFVAVEPAIAAQIALAQAAGAEVRSGVTVHSVTPRGGDGVRLATSAGEVEARKVIVAAGPWVKALVPALPVRVTRELFAWFAPRDPALFTPQRFPVFLLESRYGMHYGFPQHGTAGVKIAKHHHRDETVDPDRVDRAVTAADEALIRPVLAAHMPMLDGAMLAAKTCLYTVTPDHDFIIDRLPDAPNIIVASPCSGHGFKFAPVIGEVLAQLATEGATEHDISRFRLSRFG